MSRSESTGVSPGSEATTGPVESPIDQHPEDVLAIPGVGPYLPPVQSASTDRLSEDGWRSWMGRKVYETVPHLCAARAAEADGLRRRMIHAIVSFPAKSIDSVQGVRDAYDHAIEIADEHNVRGGLVVFHGFRIADEQSVRQLAGGFDGSPSETDLWNRLRQVPDWRDYVEWGPHFHIAGLSVDTELNISGPDDPLFKNRRSLQPFSIDDPNCYLDAKSLAFDFFNHPSFLPGDGTPPFRWFGTLLGGSPTEPADMVDDDTYQEIREMYFET